MSRKKNFEGRDGLTPRQQSDPRGRLDSKPEIGTKTTSKSWQRPTQDEISSVDKMIRQLEGTLRESLLSSIKSEGDTANIVISNTLNQFLERTSYQTFQWEELGVYSGAFGVAHESRNEFFLLQSARIPTSQQVRGINIPYLPDTSADDYKEMIDYLFLMRRKKQPLLGDDESPFAPEFFWHLARLYESGSSLEEDPARLLPPSYFEKRMRSLKLPYLYCPIGEVAFFLFAWRLLLRRGQKSGGIRSTIENHLTLDSRETFNFNSIWDKDFWELQSVSDAERRRITELPEWGWITALEELENLRQNGIANDTTGAFKKRTLDQWTRWSHEIDDSHNSSMNAWLSDWVNLSLISHEHLKEYDQPRPTETLLSLILYAGYIERCEDINKRHRILQDLREKANIIYEAIQKGSAIEWGVLEDLNLSLQRVVIHLFTDRFKGDVNLLSMLSILHKLARFPVLPFFYWTAVDKMPKEHFVFPVRESWHFPVTVKIPLNEMSETTEAREVALPCVGISLCTISPTPKLSLAAYSENFIPYAERNEVFRKTYGKLSSIVRFFRRLGTPVIDSVFFGTLVPSAAHEEGRKEGRKVEERIQISKWAHALRTRLASVLFLLKNGYPDSAKEMLNLLSRAISALTEFTEIENIASQGEKLEEYCEKWGYTPTWNIDSDIDSIESFIGIPLHALVSKLCSGTDKYGKFFDRLGLAEDELKPKLFRIAGVKFTKENWEEIISTLKECHIDIEVKTTGLSPDRYKPLIAWQDSKYEPKLVVGMFIIFLLDELLSNAVKHAHRINGEARIKAIFTLEGEYERSSCKVEITNPSTEVSGMLEDSQARRAGSGMNFCKIVADTLNIGQYSEAKPSGNGVIKATYEFPVIYVE